MFAIISISGIRIPTKLPSYFRTDFRKLYTQSTTNQKEECSRLLQLMSCNIFRPAAPPPATRTHAESQHQRCTIQSTKISTISSLVDKSKLNNSNNSTITPTPDPTIPYDTQRENYGLYALKCNRNAIRRDTLLANLAQETKHKINVYPSPIKMSPEPYYSDVNHEIFSPCQMANENPEPLNSLNYNSEYYKIEFSEEGGLKGISSNRKMYGINGTASTTSAIEPTTGIVCDSNSKSFKTQIPPPPRKKKHAIAVSPTPLPPDSSCTSYSSSSGGGVGSAVNLLSKQSKPQARLLESCKQNDLSFCGKTNDAGCSTVAIVPSLLPTSHAKVNEQREVQRTAIRNTVGKFYNNNGTSTTGGAANTATDKIINLKKNPSELYRIAEMSNKSKNLYDGNNESKPSYPIRCDAAPSETVVCAPKRHKPSERRKKLTKQFSTTDSVSIFERSANENAFDDFSDIISEEPVVTVGTTQENGKKIFSRFSSSSDGDEIIEFTKKSINCQTVTANRSNAVTPKDNNNYNEMSKTSIASHSSNEVDRKIIIREKTAVDLSSFAVGGGTAAVVMANKPQCINANQQIINNNPNNNVSNNNADTMSLSSKLYMSNNGYDDDDQQMPKPTTADEGDGLCAQMLYNNNDNNDNGNKKSICKDMERVKINNMDIDYGRTVKRLPPQTRNVYKIINLATV